RQKHLRSIALEVTDKVVFVKTLAGQELTLRTDVILSIPLRLSEKCADLRSDLSSLTVMDLKLCVQEQAGLRPEHQRMLIQGACLEVQHCARMCGAHCFRARQAAFQGRTRH